MPHHPPMKSVLWFSSACALALSLSSCGNNAGRNVAGPGAVTGPFDSQGRYIEEWADNPSKWRKSGGSRSPHEVKSDELPEIAKNDQPPKYAVPLPLANPGRSVPIISRTPATQKTTATATASTPSVTKKSQTVTTKAKPKPKSKPVLVKVKIKPKPKPKTKAVRYLVKKGDTLSAIASRTGSSVSAIKSANGISGAIIRPGQSLSIPKR